jgi:hypothetical protein
MRAEPAFPGQHLWLWSVPLKEHCCPNTPGRRITRSIYENAREVARALAGTRAFGQLRQGRKRVEMLFAHLKRILKMGRLRLRGPCGAQDEFLLAATAGAFSGGKGGSGVLTVIPACRALIIPRA